MSVPLAEAVRSFTTSIVCGKDIVCRTSVTNVGRMLDEMVRPDLVVQNKCLGSTGHMPTSATWRSG